MDFNQLIAVSKKGRQELQNLFEEDKQNIDWNTRNGSTE
jgi:CPA2 family monovalent cation:H+ antiporter-2